MFTRRAVTTGLVTGMGAAALPLPLVAQTETLRAAPGRAQIAPNEHPETAIWGYDTSVPGPEIRLAQGSRLVRRFQNDLPQGTSVHWHGIRITNSMDGVAGLTQPVVKPGAGFSYDFVVPDAGTYWYHPHNRTSEQMARGLYGALIVEEDTPPDVDADITLMLDDWRLDSDAQVAGGFGDLHDASHAGRLGNWVTVNGSGNWQRQVRSGMRLRLRLINVANARIFNVGFAGLAATTVALDGMPLTTPTAVTRLPLGPAQRADIIVDVTAEDGDEALLISHERDGGFALASFPVSGTQAARDAAPRALPPNPIAPVGPLAGAKRATLLMAGGAMGRLASARLDGKETDIRDMAAQGKVWAMNEQADMPDDPLLDLGRGETAVIRIQNDTRWPHAMHLHGMHFRQVRSAVLGPWRDTLLMDAQSEVEIAFLADNPGDWLLHCHMLEHAASGMMTWVRVT